MTKPKSWYEVDKGFYIVDQYGSSPGEQDARAQADSGFRKIRAKYRGKFVLKGEKSNEPANPATGN